MERFTDLQAILLDKLAEQPIYQRAIFKQFNLDNRVTGIIGARGIGKTTFLLQSAEQHGARSGQSLYVSADNLYFLENHLFDLADTLYKETDVRLLCIDEIHKYPNWRQELKNIADSFPDLKVLFTGSSMIDIVHGKYDLSRRVTLHHLYGFSFREYLEYTLEQEFPQLTFEALLNDHQSLAADLNCPNILKHFREYCRTGYYPYFKTLPHDIDKFQTIENATQKTIYEDIATLHSLKTPTLMIIEKLFKYTLHSQPGELNASKLASLLKKDFTNISDYLRLLEQAGLVRFLFSEKTGKAQLRNPIKLYPENTNLIFSNSLPQSGDSLQGKVRETFALNQLQVAGLHPAYGQSGDFMVDGYTLEIGGKNKTAKQLASAEKGYLLLDGILTGTKNRIPLYLLGFLN